MADDIDIENVSVEHTGLPASAAKPCSDRVTIAVICAHAGTSAVVENGDAGRMGNGCFTDYHAGAEAIFRRRRCRDNICTDQGRGLPSSNARMWAGDGGGSMSCRIEQSIYLNSCNA